MVWHRSLFDRIGVKPKAEKSDSDFWSMVYNRAIVYESKIFLKVVVHMIIIDQCNQTAR